MPEPQPYQSAGPTARQATNTPPCKRCGSRDWDIEKRPKGRLRLFFENAFAAPDVWIFQSESGGWPGKEYGLWTCRNCGRRVKVS